MIDKTHVLVTINDKSHYNADTKCSFCRRYTTSELYGNSNNGSPFQKVMAKINRHTVNRMIQIKVGYSAVECYLGRMRFSEKNHTCVYDQPKTVNHLIADCAPESGYS